MMKLMKALALGLAIAAPAAHADTLIDERFDDADLAARGWYDLKGVSLSSTDFSSAPSAMEFRFAPGALVPDAAGMRRQFAETDSVYLSYRVTYADNWVGSGQPHHPHLFYLLTNADDAWTGPAETRLTVYAEAVGGRMKLSLQDSRNIDQNRIDQDLTGITENRSVAGCNGSADATAGQCYKAGSGYRNVKEWNAPEVSFGDAPGANYKADWHQVEAFVRLNSVSDGKGIADGVLQLWVDGQLLIDRHDVLLRTGQHPDMKFNQLVLGPYIGDGSPIDQTFWIDDVVLATATPVAAEVVETVPVEVPSEVPSEVPAVAEDSPLIDQLFWAGGIYQPFGGSL